MDAETLEALKGSIAKWESIVAGTGKDQGEVNCPLCARFNPDCEGSVNYADDDNRDDGNCDGCPVAQSAGRSYCLSTPYQSYVEARWARNAANEGQDVSSLDAKMASVAQAELDFLKSLLPVTE